MEIVQTTYIELTNDEKRAIRAIMDARLSCLSQDCLECDECPLYVCEVCVGEACQTIYDRDFKKGEK